MGIVGRPVALKIVLSSSRQIEVEPDFDSETWHDWRGFWKDYRSCLDSRPRPASTWRWERPTCARVLRDFTDWSAIGSCCDLNHNLAHFWNHKLALLLGDPAVAWKHKVAQSPNLEA